MHNPAEEEEEVVVGPPVEVCNHHNYCNPLRMPEYIPVEVELQHSRTCYHPEVLALEVQHSQKRG